MPSLAFLASDNLLARAMVLGLLTLVLLIPLRMIGGVIADRHTFEAEAAKSVSEAWGGPQIFAGPMIVIPYRRASEPRKRPGFLTLLAGEAHDRRPHRARAAPPRPVRGQRLQRHARRRGGIPDRRAARAGGRRPHRIDWSAARLEVGLSDIRSIEGATVEVDGQRIDWGPGSGSTLSALKANLGALALDGRETVSVRFSLTLAGSGKLGHRAARTPHRGDAVVALAGAQLHRPLPVSQTVDKDGFRARWSASHLGRPFGQLWDGAAGLQEPGA